MAKKDKKTESEQPKLSYKYMCPACTEVAIRTSNKMLGVSVDCESCGKLIELNDPKNYIAAK